MRKWFAEVAIAATAFEARWTWLALCRVDATLAQRLREQRDLFDAAMATGTGDKVEEQGAAMCRGYQAACGALERAGVPDDAYVLGSDPVTGQRVAIGAQKAAAARVKQVYGDAVPWMSTDEVAALVGLASADAMAFVNEVKKLFPGAVVTGIRKITDQAEGS